MTQRTAPAHSTPKATTLRQEQPTRTTAWGILAIQGLLTSTPSSLAPAPICPWRCGTSSSCLLEAGYPAPPGTQATAASAAASHCLVAGDACFVTCAQRSTADSSPESAGPGVMRAAGKQIQGHLQHACASLQGAITHTPLLLCGKQCTAVEVCRRRRIRTTIVLKVPLNCTMSLALRAANGSCMISSQTHRLDSDRRTTVASAKCQVPFVKPQKHIDAHVRINKECAAPVLSARYSLRLLASPCSCAASRPVVCRAQPR